MPGGSDLRTTLPWSPRRGAADEYFRRGTGGPGRDFRLRIGGAHSSSSFADGALIGHGSGGTRGAVSCEPEWALQPRTCDLRLVRAKSSLVKVLVETPKQQLTCENAYP